MPWFWGSKSKNDDDEEASSEDEDEYDSEEYTDDEEEYTDEEEEEGAPEEAPVDADLEGGPAINGDEPTQSSAKESSGSQPNGHLPQGTDGDGESSSSGGADDDDVQEYHTSLKSDGSVDSEPRPQAVGHHSSANSHCSASTSDDNVSMIESDGLHSGDEGFLDTSDEDDGISSREGDSSSSDGEEGLDSAPTKPSQPSQQPRQVVQVETVDENESDTEASEAAKTQSEDDEQEDESPTSFWEKQSLLALAAEHDRVDILKGILVDDDQDASSLMNSGIPPLHIAISFGSTNATQSLLRMGADPSIRPDVAQVKKQAKEAPEGSKLEIPNLGRFDGVSAWELAFGNQAYEEQQKSRSSWSVFNSSSSNLSMSTRSNAADRIIKPVDMAPSKREGIRHAFTAEALRCIGGDEVERLEQLVNSGMPASIDIGGKDLYDWAVQLGGLKCEEFLRPTEAAKHGTDINVSSQEADVPMPSKATNDKKSSPSDAPSSVGKVLDRPGEAMTVPVLINRLDELESLASALSTCLDNLAEEVSVCHGLLLMGGGASALASHVKSLKTLQAQKRTQLSDAQAELEETEQELAALLQTSGSIGQEVLELAPALVRHEYSRAESFRLAKEDDNESRIRQQLLAQLAASENKILKLRASIADLSEENAKEMEQVEKRGLTGGINLVRTLRDELRDVEFQWTETKNRTATCRAQIGMIHSRMPKPVGSAAKDEVAKAEPTMVDAASKELDESANSIIDDEEIFVVESGDADESDDEAPEDQSEDEDEGVQSLAESSKRDGQPKVDPVVTSSAASVQSSTKEPPSKAKPPEPVKAQIIQDRPALPGHRKEVAPVATPETTKTESERIATGDSQALVVRPSGNRGYFTVDLWQVILRIIGMDHAANRRGAQVAQKQKGTANLMIV